MKHLFKFSLCALALTMSANTGFAQSGETGLKDAYKDYFSIGVAVNMRNISNPEQIAIIKKDFNSITAENDMKPQPTEPAYVDVGYVDTEYLERRSAVETFLQYGF